MVLRTKLTDLLGIKHPIVQGGMMWVGRAEMAAAVSNAGGLGIITGLTQPTPDLLSQEIARCRSMTKNPFGVNLTFLPSINPPPYAEYVDAIIKSGVKIVETAGNNPKEHWARLKAVSGFLGGGRAILRTGGGGYSSSGQAGVIIIHKCTSIRHALTAQRLGADMVSIDGFECAGHPGEDDVTGLILLARSAMALKIPYIASGGFGDGRGLAAALALGAEGVNMGTRFMATVEAPIHDNIKQAMVKATERDTALMFRTMHNTARVFKNSVAKQVVEIERRPGGAEFNDVKDLVSGARGRVVFENGDPEYGVWTAGQVVGLIEDIPTCQVLLDRMVKDAEEIIKGRLNAMIVDSKL
ncbi:hypothetical protein BJ742DRAFT_771513 [Cladochytrium replicatum]|nr:hypothetical protein BJ742DRAFT_771513 [Cladochytrium replicatum]